MWSYLCRSYNNRPVEPKTKKDAVLIGEVAEKLVTQFSQERSIRKKKVEKVWNKVVSKKIQPHTQPVSFRRKRLVVNVDSSTWLYELTIRKDKVFSKLKKALKDEIKELHFRIGDVKTR